MRDYLTFREGEEEYEVLPLALSKELYSSEGYSQQRYVLHTRSKKSCFSAYCDILSDHFVSLVKEIFIRKGKGRFECLDGIRAVAFIWVCCYHAYLYQLGDRDENYRRLERPFLNAISCGELGVTIFLALSGFLVAHVLISSLNRNKENSTLCKVMRFFYLRFFRIWPTLAVAAVLVQVMAAWAARRPSEWHSACGTTDTFFDYWWAQVDLGLNFRKNPVSVGCFGTTLFWSCSLEMQLYVVLPLFVFIFRNASKALALSLALLLIAFCLTLRTIETSQRYSLQLAHTAEIIIEKDEMKNDDHHQPSKKKLSILDIRWFIMSGDGDWYLYARPWYRCSEYIAGVLAYFAYLELTSSSSTNTTTVNGTINEKFLFSKENAKVQSEANSFASLLPVENDQECTAKKCLGARCSSFSSSSSRPFVLMLETIALLGFSGFAWCRFQVARAAKSPSDHRHVFHHIQVWLEKNPRHAIAVLSFEMFFVATAVSASMALMCGARDRASPLFRLLSKVLAHPAWYPISALSFTSYLLSGAPIVFLRHNRAFAADGGFLGRILTLIFISLFLGFILSLLVERPVMRISRAVLDKVASESGKNCCCFYSEEN